MLYASLLSYLILAAALHPLHVSKSVVEYNEKAKAVYISLHIFLDDMEDALKMAGSGSLQLGTEKEHPSAQKHLETYLNNRFKIAIDGQPRKVVLLGKESSDDLLGAWCYLEVKTAAPPKKIKISCSLLTEAFSDQKNIIHLLLPGMKERTFLLSKERTTAAVSL